MATRVLLTVDTELIWRHHTAGRGWEENLRRSFDPAGVGIAHQLEQLGRHGLKACFFVDPMPAVVFGIEPIRRMVETILAAGQEVQLHLHPNWTGAAAADAGRSHAAFELTSFDEDAQYGLILAARDLLIEAGAPMPIAFRAGSFAANDATMRALARAGLRFDSSHNGSQQPWPSAIGLSAEQISPVMHQGIIELPVGQLREPGGALRHLQICAISAGEIGAALAHADRHDHPLTVIVTHSFELASHDGSRPNRIVRGRFDALCRRLAAGRDSMPTVTCAELDDLPLGLAARPMATAHWRRAARLGGQVLANLEHRRSA
jgi:hypothetical protein